MGDSNDMLKWFYVHVDYCLCFDGVCLPSEIRVQIYESGFDKAIESSLMYELLRHMSINQSMLDHTGNDTVSRFGELFLYMFYSQFMVSILYMRCVMYSRAFSIFSRPPRAYMYTKTM